MSVSPGPIPDIEAGRLDAATLADNFSDLHHPLDRHEALVETDRCYFCFDAPCMEACPTSIDVPLFIRQIGAGNAVGAGRTILSANILGGMCARVCPVETLCEEACVREAAEGKPVKIGLLQRYATDHVVGAREHPFRRAAATGRRVAVVGAGPAGLSCAHRLAMLGHEVVLFDAREKAGGLNEYGIASYKATGGFAQAEVDFVLSIGGIALETGRRLGETLHLADLRETFDAVFLGIGLAGVNALGHEPREASGHHDAVAWIAELRQTVDVSSLSIGRRVVVIGGGMTAIDMAVQAKALGAEEVTLVYRRSRAAMNASLYEQEIATARGVHIRCNLSPRRLLHEGGHVHAIELVRTREEGGRLVETDESEILAADQVFRAIGQRFHLEGVDLDGFGVATTGGRLQVDEERRTSLAGVWAGGDCVARGEDLTVVAVEDGKQAALSIHAALMANMKDRGGMSVAAVSALDSLGAFLERAWSSESSTRWRADNPALGQCGVTSLVVNDRHGGQILKTAVEGEWHFYNSIDGRRVDLTASQFSRALDYQDVVSDRAEAFADTNAQQYEALTARLRAAQGEG